MADDNQDPEIREPFHASGTGQVGTASARRGPSPSNSETGTGAPEDSGIERALARYRLD